MKRVRYHVAMSLDGYIAGPNGEYDWITTDPSIDFAALGREFDTLVMGRKTFALLQRHGAGPFSKMKLVVVSTTLKTADPLHATIVRADPAAAVRALKNEPGKDIWLFGGGVLFRTLLDAGLVDTIEVGVMPILLGDGIPLLPAGRRSPPLRLVDSKALPSGILMLKYELSGTSDLFSS